MNLIDKLQIYLITYNRKNYLQRTFEQILAEDSPIKNFDITVLDNASTDGSSELIEEYRKKFPNIKHIKHKINIGGNANICRAFEMGASSGKEYVWVLCDDDLYDFSNWKEVEQKVEAKDDIICLCDYVFDNKKSINNAQKIFQLTFVPAGIYRTELITDDLLINMYDCIITMFQQCCLAISCINENKNISILSKPIVFNGIFYEKEVEKENISYTRGCSQEWNLERKLNTSWLLGFIQVLSLLKNKNIKKRAISNVIQSKYLHKKRNAFYYELFFLLNFQKFNYFYEIYKSISFLEKLTFIVYIPSFIRRQIVSIYIREHGIYLYLFRTLTFKLIPFREKKD